LLHRARLSAVHTADIRDRLRRGNVRARRPPLRDARSLETHRSAAQAHTVSTMPKQQAAKVLTKSTKLTEGEKKKIKQENKAKANPGKAADKKAKQDAKRDRRKESGSVKKMG